MQGKIVEDVLTLEGVLDENTSMEPIAAEVEKFWDQNSENKPLYIDFQNVERANSCGIFEWLKLTMNTKSQLLYINTPWWLIQQINMNDEFLPSDSRVVSLFAPFFSNNSDVNKDVLLEVGKDFPILESYEDFDFPRMDDEDGNLFEPDFDPEEFFDFVCRSFPVYKKAS